MCSKSLPRKVCLESTNGDSIVGSGSDVSVLVIDVVSRETHCGVI